MALLAQRDLLERERHLAELNLQQRQLAYLLERCNSFATQATLVTGFSFTSFSAEALRDLDFVNAPIRSFAFVLCGASTMGLSIGAVGVSSYLTGKAERMAMEVDVIKAVALVRWRMPWVVWPYYLSLLCLWSSATLLVFATCKSEGGDEEELCNYSGLSVVFIFVLLGGFVTLYPRWLIFTDVAKTYESAGANFRWSQSPGDALSNVDADLFTHAPPQTGGGAAAPASRRDGEESPRMPLAGMGQMRS